MTIILVRGSFQEIMSTQSTDTLTCRLLLRSMIVINFLHGQKKKSLMMFQEQVITMRFFSGHINDGIL